MSSSNYRFTLDMQKDQSQISIPVRKGDTDRSLYISLTNGGSPFYIENGCLALFMGLKSDGNNLANYCPIENNSVIRYDFTEQTATTEGIVDCEIRLFDSDGKLITSPRFIMVVDSRVVNDDVALSKSEHNIIDYVSAEEAKRAKAEADRQKAEDFRNESETERSANEGARETSERARSDYEIIRLENEDTRVNAETSRVEAETERATAEEIRIDNENARIASENERVLAESYRGQRVTELGIYLTESDLTIPSADYIVNELRNKTFDEGTVFVCETGAVTYITYTNKPIAGAIFIDPTSVEWLMGMLTVEPDKAYLVHGANGENAYFKTSGAFVPERNIVKKMEDRCANAIKAKASGEVVRVDDASSNEHFIECKVRSKNLFNTKADYKNGEYTYADGTLTISDRYIHKFIKVEAGKTYTFSCKSTRTGVDGGGVHIRAYKEDQKSYVDIQGGSVISILSPTVTVTMPKGYPYIRLALYGHALADGTGTATYTELMLEEGSEATGYVPYVDPSTTTVTRCGKNIIPYPYAETTVTKNGITFTDNGDGSIKINGTATAAASFNLAYVNNLGETIFQPGSNSAENKAVTNGKFTFSGGAMYNSVHKAIILNIPKGTTVDNLTVFPQAEYGTEATDFVLNQNTTNYKPNADGVVEDIKSVAPTMTLLTDTENVVLEIEYNQDINVLLDYMKASLRAILDIQNSLIGGES